MDNFKISKNDDLEKMTIILNKKQFSENLNKPKLKIFIK